MHISRRIFAISSISIALALSACASSPDEARAELRSTVQDASGLSSRIIAWRRGIGHDVSAHTVTEISAFQERAEDLLDRLEDFGTEATKGVDLSDLEHALQSLSEMEVSRFEAASNEARVSLLDQLERSAKSVGESARRVATELV